MFTQMPNFFENFLLAQQCGFRKGYNTQHCLLSLLQKWKCTFDRGEIIGALMSDMAHSACCCWRYQWRNNVMQWCKNI